MQLTTDFFTEITPAFINPHTDPSKWYEFGSCTQSGSYPNTTSIDSCSLGVANSFNPFVNTWEVNYSDVVGGRSRGEIVSTQSGNPYGLEQFLFGFDNIDHGFDKFGTFFFGDTILTLNCFYNFCFGKGHGASLLIVLCFRNHLISFCYHPNCRLLCQANIEFYYNCRINWPMPDEDHGTQPTDPELHLN